MENKKNEVFEIIGPIEGQEEKTYHKEGTLKVFKKITIKGRVFNVFDEKLFSLLKTGEYIKAKYNESTKGEYTYKSIFFITKSSEAEMNAQVPNEQTTLSPKNNNLDQRIIVKQNVLNRAVDMFIADKIKKEEILTTANNFLKWVYDKFEFDEEDEETDLPEETMNEIIDEMDAELMIDEEMVE